MRLWHLGALGVLTVALTGCTQTTTGGGTGGPPKADAADKLKTAMVGKWEGGGEKKPTYEFKKDGKFDFAEDKLKFSGDWKVVDDKHVELKYALTEDQIKDAKELKIEPEPKKDNENKVEAKVDGESLTLGSEKLKKPK
jgi:hypothetical protein